MDREEVAEVVEQVVMATVPTSAEVRALRQNPGVALTTGRDA